MIFSVVIPTYNEKDNIEKLVQDIFALGISGLQVLVVDDNSPDGTGAIAESLRAKYSGLDVIHRAQKQGLGPAYIEGFEHALRKGADYIIQMDADFSHDPKYIPKFLEKIRECDVVVGSRYIIGGGVRNWNMVRRVISRIGNFYARIALGVSVRDLTGGFRCYRFEVLKSIDLKNISSIGYCFQIETIYKAFQKGFSIHETPILFTERRSGRSKFSVKIMLESFWRVFALRFFH